MNIEVQEQPFDPDQWGELKTLFGSYFPPEDNLLSAAYSEWLYVRNPVGVARVVVATVGKRWVGFLAMIPVYLARGCEHRLAYYVVNVLVHPDYQGKHLFGRMITVAKEHATAEGAFLMGHPNRMALPMWRRARMQFRETLRPSLHVPALGRRGLRGSDIERPEQVQSLQLKLAEQAARSDQWQVVFSWDYLAWRYLRHPFKRYRTRLLERDGVAVAVQVTRRIRPGVHLWVDQFSLTDSARDAFTHLPWLTVSFRPELLNEDLGGARWALPIRKEIPFFCTQAGEADGAEAYRGLGLSASDF